MSFQVSPGVNISEIDLTTVIPAVSTTDAAIAGVFRWGPVEKTLLIDSEDALSARYGKPTTYNAETWFTAASFLAYGNKLNVSRAFVTGDANTVLNSFNAVANTGSVADSSRLVKNEDHYELVTFDSNCQWIAKYPGAIGNSLKISVCDSIDAFSSIIQLDAYEDESSELADSITLSFAVGSNTATITVSNTSTNAVASEVVQNIYNDLAIGDLLRAGNSTVGFQQLKITGKQTPTANSTAAVGIISFETRYNLSGSFSTSTAINRNWEFSNIVDSTPNQSTHQINFGNTAANDELHVVVVDQGGQISGVPGTVLEVFQGLSRAVDAKTEDGGTNYYKDIINETSKFVWFANDRTNAVSDNSALLESSINALPYTQQFVGGQDTQDESTVEIAAVIKAYDLFKFAENIDVSLVLAGKSRGGVNGEQIANYLIDNIATTRKDCVVFLSPERSDVVSNTGGDEEADVVQFRNSVRSSSYAVMDSGYKYQYDKYNDVYRWIPLNGDIAGLCADTDETDGAWFSPAGFNRGQIKNIIKLAWNPGQAQRDILYKNGVNPVVNFPGQGIVLYGDKTLQSKPSAFDRINVRRLFIVLEKAIATSAQFTLFEFNDEFTRSTFVSLVTPFLREIQGQRGITDFSVVCDETNNTPQVIDSNQFVGDIYIKPSRSINFIQLNFVAVRSGVEFSEIVRTV